MVWCIRVPVRAGGGAGIGHREGRRKLDSQSGRMGKSIIFLVCQPKWSLQGQSKLV